MNTVPRAPFHFASIDDGKLFTLPITANGLQIKMALEEAFREFLILIDGLPKTDGGKVYRFKRARNKSGRIVRLPANLQTRS